MDKSVLCVSQEGIRLWLIPSKSLTELKKLNQEEFKRYEDKTTLTCLFCLGLQMCMHIN